MKLKDSKDCMCRPPRGLACEQVREWYRDWYACAAQKMLPCACCVAFLCPACGLRMLEAGAVFCKRKHQWYRQLIYADMDTKLHAAVKANKNYRRRWH